MKKLFKLAFAALLISGLAVFQFCKKDKDTTPVYTGPSNFPLEVTVLSENGSPITEAVISIGQNTVVTDNNGKATITSGAPVNNKFKVSVKKSGFYDGFKNVSYISGANKHYTTIKMIQKQLVGVVNSSSQSNLPSTNFRVELNGQGFKDAGGNAYSGDVYVFARYIDASDMDKLAELMPGGDFSGLDNSSNSGILESYGFTAIEFVDASGNRLTANPNSAQVAIQLPTEALNQVNSEGANFWSFNESNLVWNQGQSLSTSGNEVYMPVTSSTFGNCDKIRAKATIKARFICNNTSSPVKGKMATLKGKTGYAMVYKTESNENGNILVEVGVPSSGGTYELTIDGFTMQVPVTANQVKDLGNIDVCNLQGQDGNPRFNLKWTGAADLDLYVKTPNGEIISYNNPTSTNGGQLDIDCICSCSSPAENIFWDPTGPNGTYTYWVEYFDACDAVVAANFTITVRFNGSNVATKTGQLSSVGAKSQEWTYVKQ